MEFNMEGFEMMGENVKALLKACGEGVRLMPLAKIANPDIVDLGDYCRVRDFVFICGKPGKKNWHSPEATYWLYGEII